MTRMAYYSRADSGVTVPMEIAELLDKGHSKMLDFRGDDHNQAKWNDLLSRAGIEGITTVLIHHPYQLTPDGLKAFKVMLKDLSARGIKLRCELFPVVGLSPRFPVDPTNPILPDFLAALDLFAEAEKVRRRIRAKVGARKAKENGTRLGRRRACIGCEHQYRQHGRDGVCKYQRMDGTPCPCRRYRDGRTPTGPTNPIRQNEAVPVTTPPG